MKICWDTLEILRYNPKTNKWYNIESSSYSYTYEESCKNCDEPYLKLRRNKDFCSKECFILFNKGKNHIAYGRILSNETKEKISKSVSGKNNWNYGKIGKNHSTWTGGYYQKNLPLYDTYAHQIEYAEEVRRNKDDENILEVKCAYCGKWYVPKRNNILHRIQALNFLGKGEHRFYCSQECKKECPIFLKRKYSAEETNTKQYSREVQPQLRQLVFERDNYTCQKCGSTQSLHCHHIEGIRHDPLESADIDKCITYCKKCHKEVHKIEGCKTTDMRCKI